MSADIIPFPARSLAPRPAPGQRIRAGDVVSILGHHCDLARFMVRTIDEKFRKAVVIGDGAARVVPLARIQQSPIAAIRQQPAKKDTPA